MTDEQQREGAELEEPTITKTDQDEMAEKQGQTMVTSFDMNEAEIMELFSIQQDKRFLKSELQAVDVKEQNFWLRLQLRTGLDMRDCTADTRTGKVYPPGVKPTI